MGRTRIQRWPEQALDTVHPVATEPFEAMITKG